ncbi:hypothetical protein ONE63_008356 [Megalurothrips usitatus]|uniref:CWH43-like N-terminal domain-containing protein n=1 Tax=Megalurothrips usitatus TaxID=439358 RepID=A0AAV7XQ23_9NEOP|nr:hypothetical protein ONE63_008356 [Megalurothrips usitatus]
MNALGYLPLAQDKRQTSWLRVPFGKLAWITVSLPLFAFIFCVIWSVLFNFDRATFTHCKVENYLPSISAAIGNFSPQRDVWRTAIGTHALPRLLVASKYYSFYKAVLYKWAHFLAAVACWLTVIENLALVGLTFVSSSDNYPAHEKLFIIFLISSELYMVLTCFLVSRTRAMPPEEVDRKSLRTKWRLLITNISFSLMAVYWFMRHNSYCEPGVYTLFALSEYVVVLTNMAFHMTAYWDFNGCILVVGSRGIHLR